MNAEYIHLVKLLKSIQRFKIEIHSVTKYHSSIDPKSTLGVQKLKGMLENQVRSSNCAFILPEIFVSNPFWIKKALYLCQMYGVSPLVLSPKNGEDLPAELYIKSKAIIAWNIESLEEGVRTFSTTRFGAT